MHNGTVLKHKKKVSALCYNMDGLGHYVKWEFVSDRRKNAALISLYEVFKIVQFLETV